MLVKTKAYRDPTDHELIADFQAWLNATVPAGGNAKHLHHIITGLAKTFLVGLSNSMTPEQLAERSWKTFYEEKFQPRLL